MIVRDVGNLKKFTSASSAVLLTTGTHSHHDGASCCLYRIAVEQVWAALSRHGGMDVENSSHRKGSWKSLALIGSHGTEPLDS